MHIHLSPLVPEKFVDDSFETFIGWLVHCLLARWPATIVVQRCSKLPRERHSSHTVWRARLGGTQVPEPVVSITASNFETTRQRFILR